MDINSLKVGDRLRFNLSPTRISTVLKIEDSHCTIKENGRIFVLQKAYITNNFTNLCDIEKPLDKAFKQLDKQLCTHKNIKEDRYFSAMIYKTCKDCGKALN